MAERRLLLAVLVALSGATLASLVLVPPRPPLPAPFGLQPPASWGLQPLPAPAARRQRDLSAAAGQRFRWHRSPGASLELELQPVRLRRYQDLGVTALQRLRQRPAWASDALTIRRLGTDEVALVQLPPLRQLHTCVVPGQRAAALDLGDLLQVPPAQPLSRLRVVLGLEPPRRWECLLVTLSLPDGPQSQQQLSTAWRQLRPLLP